MQYLPCHFFDGGIGSKCIQKAFYPISRILIVLDTFLKLLTPLAVFTPFGFECVGKQAVCFIIYLTRNFIFVEFCYDSS